jgi:SAM-dependent methyltransferase
MDRRQVMYRTMLSFLLLAPTHSAQAMTNDPKTNIALPDVGEIERAVPTNWDGIENPFSVSSSSMFDRLDTTNDALFYSTPRFVEHVDDNAVRLMTDYISNEALLVSSSTSTSSSSGINVLDLGASWTSHISPSAAVASIQRMVGIGMNQEELQANPILTEWIVQDLNRPSSPSNNTNNMKNHLLLPWEDNTFDVVLCQLSIDYLTRPLEVLQEVGRVLKPGGTVHILFSNRLFLTKAVGLWTGADDIDHVYTVACYLHFCSSSSTSSLSFGNIHAKDLSTRTKGRDKRIVGDPLYVVVAERMG